MRFGWFVLGFFILTASACESRRAPHPAQARGGQPSGQPTLAEPGTQVPPPNPMPQVPPPEGFPPVPPSPDPQDERRTEQALAAAADSAEQAAAGADDCESAHNQLLAMYATVERELGGTMHRPERQAFLEVCRQMPVPARRCIVPTYAMEHQDDCAVALDALPEDVQQHLSAVVNGPGAD